ncbi:T9SS type A sorting domain-containing protein [bacterium SCSIO 12741]|nr:T9SS type A sorting domain-containing protein [bacterium SCSIO 12741]
MPLKLYISFILSILSLGSVQAQHWEALSPRLESQFVGSFYHDTVTDHLYHTGQYLVNGSPGGLFRWDSLGNFEKLDSTVSQTPHSNYSKSVLRHNNELFVGGVYKYMGDTNNPINCLSILDNDSFYPTSVRLDTWNPSINTLYSYKGNLLIGGAFDSINGLFAPGMVLWDGVEFRTMPVIQSRNYLAVDVHVFAEYKDNLYVGGLFSKSKQERNLQVLANDRWQKVNGWQVLGLFGEVFTMKVYKGELYIGGTFSKQHGGIANYIVKYDGEHFYELGEGFDFYVYDFEVYNDYLYVFGLFEEVDGLPCPSKVARWDGERWCRFSSDSIETYRGISDGIFYHDSLYVTGRFDSISNDKSIVNTAKWTGDLETTICHPDKANIQKVGVYDVGVSELEGEQETFSFYPNPTSGLVTIQSEKWMDIGVVDLSGRVLLRQSIHPGGQSMDLSNLSSGAYYLISIDPKELPARNGHSGLLIKY